MLHQVISYQLLKNFLTDDKFPLQNKTTLFQQLSSAIIFSKFNVKAGFWQVGIDPKEMPKQKCALLTTLING